MRFDIEAMPGFEIELAELGRKAFQPRNAGAFYGRAAELSAGAGVLFKNVAYPVFNEKDGRFQVRQGIVLVLTHECDIDQSNARMYNEHFVFVPLIMMKDFAAQFEAAKNEKAAREIVTAAAGCNIQRLTYLPPAHGMVNAPELEHGAFIYWNMLAHTHITQLKLDGVAPLCALSQYGLQLTDRMFQTHFLRPKAEMLPRLH